MWQNITLDITEYQVWDGNSIHRDTMGEEGCIWRGVSGEGVGRTVKVGRNRYKRKTGLPIK
jgi:hypothetical protein